MHRPSAENAIADRAGTEELRLGRGEGAPLRHERHFRCQAKAAGHRVTGAPVILLSSRVDGSALRRLLMGGFPTRQAVSRLRLG